MDNNADKSWTAEDTVRGVRTRTSAMLRANRADRQNDKLNIDLTAGHNACAASATPRGRTSVVAAK
jgi:hypothetical protein